MNILPNIILFLIAKTCLHFQQWWMAAFAQGQDWGDGVRDNDGSKSRQLSPSMSNALASRVEVKLGRLTERTRVFACLSDLALKRVFIRTCGFLLFCVVYLFSFFCFFSPLWPNCETNRSAEGFGKQRMTVLLQNVTPLDVGPRERLHMFPFPASHQDKVVSTRLSRTSFIKSLLKQRKLSKVLHRSSAIKEQIHDSK